MTALARFLRHRPLAFAPGRGLGSCSVPRHFPIPTGRPVDAYSVRSPLRPQILLAPLSDPTILRQPRGLLPELPREMVAHPLRQVLLRSQTGQLLRRDFHPHGWCRYRLHLPVRRTGGLSYGAAAQLNRALAGLVSEAVAWTPIGLSFVTTEGIRAHRCPVAAGKQPAGGRDPRASSSSESKERTEAQATDNHGFRRSLAGRVRRTQQGTGSEPKGGRSERGDPCEVCELRCF